MFKRKFIALFLILISTYPVSLVYSADTVINARTPTGSIAVGDYFPTYDVSESSGGSRTIQNLIDLIEATILTITADWVNTANPWAENEIVSTVVVESDVDNTPASGVTTDPISSGWAYTHVNTSDPHSTLSLIAYWETTARTSAPGTPAEKIFYLADNSSWDPCTITGTVPYWCLYDGADYVAVMDIDGKLLIAEERIGQATYASTGTISSTHLYGWKIDNYGQSTDAVLTLPAVSDAETNALVEIVDTSNAFYVCPPSGGVLLFKAYDGTLSSLDADDCVGYASGASVGEEMRITSYQTGASTYAYKVAVTIGTHIVDSGDQ